MKYFELSLKLVLAIFYQIFIFHKMKAVYEKCLLFDRKSYFSSRDIQIFVFPTSPFFLPVNHCFRGCSKINLKGYLHYKTITPENVSSEGQVNNYFIS